MVELQSFYHHQTSQGATGYYHHHPHQVPPDNSNGTKGRPPNSGNYALPYDVLSRENGNIYGQRAPAITANSQSQQLVEPLYATTKTVANFNHFCQKVCFFVCLSGHTANQQIIVPLTDLLSNVRRWTTRSSLTVAIETAATRLQIEPTTNP